MATKPIEFDKAQQALDVKLKHIAITRSRENRENSFFEQRTTHRIERHHDALKDLVSATDSSKRAPEGLKIANGDEIEGITAWGEKIENTIGEADIDLDMLQSGSLKARNIINIFSTYIGNKSSQESETICTVYFSLLSN